LHCLRFWVVRRAGHRPFGRIAHPAQIARTIAFPLSSRANFLRRAALFAAGGCDAVLRAGEP
jgi:NAD(P)-dependent dehydrogenase (short-subunit alcohol dehydrogenase family)